MKISNFRSKAKRLLKDERGNVLMIMALSIIPVIGVVGSGIDYGRAARAKMQLNALADAAALMGVTSAELVKSQTQVQLDVVAMFNAQAASALDVNYDPANLTVTVTQNSPNNALSRTVNVAYTATTTNYFMGVIGSQNVAIAGQSTATVANAPNIDFYVLMDMSPSMAIPATSAGITQLKAATNGCAFACHENAADSLVTSDSSGNQIAFNITLNGKKVDFYTYATQNASPITLRVDEEKSAVSALMTTATTDSALNHATYRMSLTSFANTTSNFQSLTSDLSAAATAASTIPQLFIDGNANNPINNDQLTQFGNALATFNNSGQPNYIANPGTGSSTSTPQKYLFIITDGFDDSSRYGSYGAINTANCTNLKNRGIKIGILYTKYLPDFLKGKDNKYFTFGMIAPAVTQLTPGTSGLTPTETALQTCATTGLYYTVTQGQDIQTSLNALFLQAISQPVLTK